MTKETKQFYVMLNVGSSKYVVKFHDGIKLHDDGSEFFDIEIFKNKKDLSTFTKSLIKKNYLEK